MKSKQQFKSQFAIPFIYYDQKNEFALNTKAQHFLQNIPQHQKLGVISIVGKYHTGKSFLVNKVLLDTKMDLPSTLALKDSGSEKEVILIDNEGFGGMDQNVNNDIRILTSFIIPLEALIRMLLTPSTQQQIWLRKYTTQGHCHPRLNSYDVSYIPVDSEGLSSVVNVCKTI